MNKVITKKEARTLILAAKKEAKKTVLVTGCFDLLHPGHIIFLDAAKKAGDLLFIALESDSWIKKKKGKNRPILTMKNRLRIMSSLKQVDYVFPLKEQAGIDLLEFLSPDILAVSEGDSFMKEKEKAAKTSGSQVEVVCPQYHYSTSALIWKCRRSS